METPTAQAAARLAAIASGIEAQRPDDTLRDLLEQACSSCERAAAGERSRELASLLAQVQTAARTWGDVWPRLGRQREFRLAVAREARLWSKRLMSVHVAAAPPS